MNTNNNMTDWEVINEGASLNDRYRNGGEMHEELEPRVHDTVDWFSRARGDFRMVGNQLRSMGMPFYSEE